MGRKTKPGPKELANLKPIQKGQVLNPLGINQRTAWTDAIRDHGHRLLSADEDGKKLALALGLDADKTTWLEVSVHRLFRAAVTGDLAAIREIMDRCEGTPARKMEISTPRGTLLRVKVSYDRPQNRNTTEDDGL